MKIFCRSLMWILFLQSLVYTADAEKLELKWGSTSKHSGLYANTTSIVEIVNKAYPQKIDAKVVETQGFSDNLTKIKKKSIDLGSAGILEASAAYNGLSEYEGNPIGELRSLWGGYVTPIHIIASKKSGITSIDMIDGLDFAMNPGTTSGKLLQLFFDAYEIKPVYKEYSIALSLDAMKNGAVKCWYKAGFRDVRDDPIVELEKFMEINILPVNKAMIDKMNAKYKGYGLGITVPENTYQALKQNQLSLAYVVSDFVHKDVLEDVVYKIVKAVWGKKRQLIRQLDTLREGGFAEMYEMALDYGLAVPFHPGAAKFYQEKSKGNIPQKLLPPEMKSPLPPPAD